MGIPTIADRVVQASLKLVLEPIFEADFQPCSDGFRPNRRVGEDTAGTHTPVHKCAVAPLSLLAVKVLLDVQR